MKTNLLDLKSWLIVTLVALSAGPANAGATCFADVTCHSCVRVMAELEYYYATSTEKAQWSQKCKQLSGQISVSGDFWICTEKKTLVFEVSAKGWTTQMAYSQLEIYVKNQQKEYMCSGPNYCDGYNWNQVVDLGCKQDF